MKVIAASCCKIQDTNPQPVWTEIQNEKPDVLLLLGDNIYLDHDAHDDAQALAGELRRRYTEQLQEPAFAALLADMQARGAATIAIYDDHDFLGNDRYGGDNPPALREAARAELVRAFAPVRTGLDVYHAYQLGLVDIIVLDERFYRRSPSQSAGDRNAVLGLDQWSWLENTLNTTGPAKYRLIASSTTIHTWGNESWEQYPMAFHRLRELIAGKPGVFVVSGDVHRNATYDDSGILEIVTSAVARNSIFFGRPRRNYGVFEFDADAMHVDLRSNKVGWRFKFSVPLGRWELP